MIVDVVPLVVFDIMLYVFIRFSYCLQIMLLRLLFMTPFISWFGASTHNALLLLTDAAGIIIISIIHTINMMTGLFVITVIIANTKKIHVVEQLELIVATS